MIRIVFTSADGADRACMAAAYFNALADTHIARAVAAWDRADSVAHADVVEAMREAGIDLRDARPVPLDAALLRDARMWIVLGRDGFDVVAPPRLRRVRWEIADPSGGGIVSARAVRDEIRRAVRRLIVDAGWGPGVWL